MDLLELAKKDGRSYNKVSTREGGEYHGPCPACGGTDRFHIWPHQGLNGTFWCRQCARGGDAIQYLMDFERMTFKDACKTVGKELPEHEDYQAPRFRPQAAAAFVPRETTAPADPWIQHATKFVDWAHQRLLASSDQLAWLAARGLDLSAVTRYRLGWNPGEKGKDLYRVRESWGLPSVYKDDGITKKKLWLPVGLVIPCFDDGETLLRVRIRRPEGEPRYYLVPGSGTAPMLLGLGARAWVIVESELDALLIHHLAGDLVGAISQGNSTAKPDAYTMTCLEPSLAILVALDSDQAGMQASVWWKKQYPQAERWPVPVGKDPGDAFKAGIDIREWVKAGLPPVLTLPPVSAPLSRREPKPAGGGEGPDRSGAGVSWSPPESEPAPPVVHIITAKDGRTVHITDSPTEYDRLTASGAIVFDSQELALVKQSGADQDQAAAYLNFKQAFPGIRITNVRPDSKAPVERPRYRGKFDRSGVDSGAGS